MIKPHLSLTGTVSINAIFLKYLLTSKGSISPTPTTEVKQFYKLFFLVSIPVYIKSYLHLPIYLCTAAATLPCNPWTSHPDLLLGVCFLLLH